MPAPLLSPIASRPRSLALALALVLPTAGWVRAQQPDRPKDPVAQVAPQVQRQTQLQSQTQIPTQREASSAASTSGRPLSVPGAVALSPDGQLIAWTLRGHGGAEREGVSLHLTEVHHPDGPAKIVAIPDATDCGYGDPVWAPNGETLAFLGACTAPAADATAPRRQGQIYLWSKATGTVRQLTHLTGNLQQLAWSPDGKAIGFLFVENASRSAGALDAMKPYSGVIGEDGVEVQQIAVVNATDGGLNWKTNSGLHVYEFTWSPDSKEVAFVAANPPGENNWWVAKLYKQDVLPRGVEAKMGASVVLAPSTVSGPLHGLQIAVPRWSPDGKQIAFIGGLMSDQGSTGGDLYTVNADGGQPTDITPGLDGTPSYEVWLNDHAVGFIEDRRGHTLLVDWDTRRKAALPGTPIDLGEVSVGGGPVKDAVSYVHADGETLAFTQQGFNQPPEIWTLNAHGPKQVTHLNTGVKPNAHTESVEWTNGAFHVQGWLTFPANYDPSRKYPIIVTVHGGPSASVTARWGGGQWAERGYFELQPNPRGSFGQGEAFTEANRKDFGYGDLHDIEAGLDFVEEKYSIDHTREGVTGWSYGGFMTMFSVTQTHRFKAAVAGAGLADWLSYYGENSIDQWMIPFFGASVYDDPAVYAKSSAITYIKSVTTPTLVIVGDRDGECPAPQSFEFWHALRDLGVKTQLVVYPNEGHGFRDPDHIRDRAERTAKWFADNMPASPQTVGSTPNGQ